MHKVKHALYTHYPKNEDCEQEGSSPIWVNTLYSKKISTHQHIRTSCLIYNTYAPEAGKVLLQKLHNIITLCSNKQFENRVLRKTIGLEGIRQRRKLYNEKLQDLFSPSNILRTMKSRRMRWVRPFHIQAWGRREIHTVFWWGKVKKRNHLVRSRHRWEKILK
jgi:hypothetical protein